MNNKELEASFRKAKALGDDIREMESIDALAAYRQSQMKIRGLKRMRLHNQLIHCAAFLAIPLLLASLILGYLYFAESEEEIRYAEVISTMGTVVRYELPDHSVVWLNSGSKLRYPTVFKNGLSVYVYGTQFNVTAYEDDNYIETVLEKGKVNVVTPGQETITLIPGEQLVYDKQTRQVQKNKVDVYGKVAWKDGKLIFRNASLEEIIKRLERHFNVDIEFNNHLGKEYSYRATFRTETLTQILDYLAKSANLKWKILTPEQREDDTFTKTKIIVDLY